jgi:selenocysteine-specific elongation factor
MTNFILATAGHVDHGKSALVKALTGTDPDRLPEEKARGITIDLGFAHLKLSAPPSTFNQGQSGSDPSTFSVGIVDVPGHEDFVRNMIAGVGSIDLALLVVAADDGWMPQTEEHLQILIYLGVQRIVVALTKSDLGKIDNATAQIRKELTETPFANCPIVPTSIRTGAGIEDLKSALAAELAKLAPPRNVGKPRLFVDRVFKLHGIGTVVTGTLSGGTLRAGESVFVQPRNRPVRIRSLQTHGRDVDLVQTATRTAINLPDLEVESDVQRGDVITTHQLEPSSTLDVVLYRSPRLERAAPIKSGASVYVHHGTTRVRGKIVFAETGTLLAGNSAIAQLRLSTPLLGFVGDRFVIRDASEQHTIAGGVVFNLGGLRSDQERALLATRAVAPDDVALAVWTEIARTGLIERAQLLERSPFNATEIAEALERLAKHGEIFLTDHVGAKMLLWREFRNRVAKLIDAAHKAHPERRGLELSELRTELSSLSPVVFDALIVDLCAGDFVRVGSAVAKKSHQANLPPELKAAAEKIVSDLGSKPFDPPNRKDLLDDDRSRQALKFLIEHDEIAEISDEIVLLRDSLEKMQTAISDLISSNGPATASQLREKLGTSRRVIIPVLEYFDRKGVTRRVGDQRVLAQNAPVAKVTDAADAPRN